MECKCETCVRKDCSERTKQDDLRIVIQCDDYVAKNKTNGDRIRAMNDDELAEFIMLSPEMEFGVCECCEVFRGHGAYTPCGTENGWCTAELRCSAFKKWLQQPVEEV